MRPDVRREPALTLWAGENRTKLHASTIEPDGLLKNLLIRFPLLRRGGERRSEEAEGEGDRECRAHDCRAHARFRLSGTGRSDQISSAYSLIVRSELNRPIRATFSIALRAHARGSR